jgi:hypothetical protein
MEQAPLVFFSGIEHRQPLGIDVSLNGVIDELSELVRQDGV